MFPKRLLALTLSAALTVMEPYVLRAQWAPTNGPFGGTVSGMDRIGTKLFATTGFGGFESSDYGNQWSEPDSTFVANFILSRDSLLFASTGNGFYRSTDSGATWDSIAFGFYDFLGTLGATPTCLVLSADTIVYRSTNNGDTWFAIPDMGNAYVTTFFTNNSTIYAGTGGGVYISNDDGLTWQFLGNGIPNTIVNSVAVAGSKLFAGTDSGLFCSSDQGVSWTGVGTGLTADTIYALAVVGSHFFAGTDNGIYLSTDSGMAWTSSGLSGRQILGFEADGQTLLAGTYGEGVYRTTDSGNSWQFSNAGLACAQPWALVFMGSELYSGTMEGGVVRTGDNGMNWLPVNQGLQILYNQVLACDGQNLYAGSYYGLCRSTDSGAHWVSFNEGLTDSSIRSMVATRSFLAVGTYDSGVFVRTPEDGRWRQANNGLDNGLKSRSVSAMILTDFGLFAGPEWRNCISNDQLRAQLEQMRFTRRSYLCIRGGIQQHFYCFRFGFWGMYGLSVHGFRCNVVRDKFWHYGVPVNLYTCNDRQ